MAQKKPTFLLRQFNKEVVQKKYRYGTTQIHSIQTHIGRHK